MDEGFIFYIILAVIALISQLLKKKKGAPPPSSQGGGQAKPRPQKKPFSFEEILKEFQAEVLQEEPEVQPTVKPQPVKEQKKEASISRAKREKRYETFEGTSYEEATTDNEKLEEKLKKYKRDDHYDISEKEQHPILKLLQSDDGPKNAIVLSEIINRKYE